LVLVELLTWAHTAAGKAAMMATIRTSGRTAIVLLANMGLW